ncbi:MAG TPA: TetR/AcrR family transcriptional regulator [Candidatus Dormibacteraeota bacterium]|nr:TetR/AcrR family transcriptional regulator [Candidatus Dormibacteraeota bacterium]
MAEAVKETRAYRASLRQEQADLTRRRIMEAGRRLLAKGTYSAVTMREVAAEAGVSYQTVYAIFGNKLQLAQAIIEAGWPHVAEALSLVGDARRSDDPEVWLRVAGRISRRIYELCADLPRFMRESGDPTLKARYESSESERYRQFEEVRAALEHSGRLRAGLTASEAHAILWGLTGPDWYCLLVFERGWKPARYEEWVGQSLIELLLEPVASSPASA